MSVANKQGGRNHEQENEKNKSLRQREPHPDEPFKLHLRHRKRIRRSKKNLHRDDKQPAIQRRENRRHTKQEPKGAPPVYGSQRNQRHNHTRGDRLSREHRLHQDYKGIRRAKR